MGPRLLGVEVLRFKSGEMLVLCKANGLQRRNGHGVAKLRRNPFRISRLSGGGSRWVGFTREVITKSMCPTHETALPLQACLLNQRHGKNHE